MFNWTQTSTKPEPPIEAEDKPEQPGDQTPLLRYPKGKYSSAAYRVALVAWCTEQSFLSTGMIPGEDYTALDCFALGMQWHGEMSIDFKDHESNTNKSKE